MSFILFHNPNCSKSRECLKLLQEKKVDFKIRNYIKEKLNKNELKKIIEGLNNEDLNNILRTKNAIDFDYNNKKKLIKYLEENQKDMQRPIFFNKKKYTICRPPEKVLMVEGVGFEPT